MIPCSLHNSGGDILEIARIYCFNDINRVTKHGPKVNTQHKEYIRLKHTAWMQCKTSNYYYAKKIYNHGCNPQLVFSSVMRRRRGRRFVLINTSRCWRRFIFVNCWWWWWRRRLVDVRPLVRWRWWRWLVHVGFFRWWWWWWVVYVGRWWWWVNVDIGKIGYYGCEYSYFAVAWRGKLLRAEINTTKMVAISESLVELLSFLPIFACLLALMCMKSAPLYILVA